MAKDRERRYIYPLLIHDNLDFVTYALSSTIDVDNIEQKSYVNAINYSHCDKWCDVICDEVNSLKKNNTWIIVKKPKNVKLVGYGWLFEKKKEYF